MEKIFYDHVKYLWRHVGEEESRALLAKEIILC